MKRPGVVRGERNRAVGRGDATRTLMRLFVDHPNRELSGSDVIGRTSLDAALVYPLLHKLAQCGILDVREVPERRAPGESPDEIWYQLSSAGATVAPSVLDDPTRDVVWLVPLRP